VPIRIVFSAALFLLLLGLTGAGLSRSQEPATARLTSVAHLNQTPAESRDRPSAAARFQFQGAGSCAAAACHNGDPLGPGRREYGIALERDPSEPARFKDRHAEAYEALFSERSRTIERNLKGLDAIDAAHPEHNALCLRCHVHPEWGRVAVKMSAGVRQFRLEDGVSCEVCHGPAEHWLADHLRGDWRSLDAQAKKSRGMADTRSLTARIRLCVDCHVGAPDMDVDHDLIAAGHPRLNFEFSASHAELHKHWDFAKDKDPSRDPRGRTDFEARAWAVGQIVSAQAALRLLAERADDQRRPWPELAEYNCYACHHDLQPKGWRQRNHVRGQAGILTWSPWYTAMLGEALSALDVDPPKLHTPLGRLAAELASPQPNRAKTSQLARQTAGLLESVLQRADASPALLPVEALLQKVLNGADPKPSVTWDHAAPRYAALAALGRARADRGRPLTGLGALAEVLRFPRDFDSPRNYDPAQFEQAIRDLKQQTQQ
jgi:cytochrome c554/c'-like protein